MKLEGIKKAKSKKNIGGYKIKGYRQTFYPKKPQFSGQKKLENIPEKIANMLAKTFKRFVSMRF